MPVLKSFYTIKQFKEAFQKHAYKLALEAVQKMPTLPDHYDNTLTIEAIGPRLIKVSTHNETIDFEGTLSYMVRYPSGYGYLSFSIEEKLYNNSSHNSKISFYPDDSSQIKETQEKIHFTVITIRISTTLFIHVSARIWVIKFCFLLRFCFG